MLMRDARESLRGLEHFIFDHVCMTATPQQWAEWLMLPLQQAALEGDREITLKLMAAGARGKPLPLAVLRDHQELVDDLLLAGEDTDTRGEFSGEPPLNVASSRGHIGIVRSLLRGGADKHAKSLSGYTALHRASQRGHLPVVRALLATNVGVNLISSDGKVSALALACRGGHLGIAKVLIRHGAAVGACPPAGYTPLHEAAMGNHPRCVTALVEAGADIEASERHSGWNRTPLHCAAKTGGTEAAATLLRLGAAMSIQDDSPKLQTPLHLAIKGEYLGVVHELLCAGVNVSLNDRGGYKYMRLAARVGHVGVLKSLIERGASVNAVCVSTQRSPLHVAAENNKVEAIDALVEAGADPMAYDRIRKIPLHYAAREGSCEAVAALLRHGSDKDKADRRGQTPLHAAASRGFTAVSAALLTAGANVSARDLAGDSALDGAAKWGCESVLKRLAEHGADVNTNDSRGMTALHKATLSKEVGSIHALVRMGAIVDAQNAEGCTPLMCAARDEEGGCATLLALLNHGANVNARDARGTTPLHFAVDSANLAAGVPREVRVLLEWDADESAVDKEGISVGGLVRRMDYVQFGNYELDPEEFADFTAWSDTRSELLRLFERAPADRKKRSWRRRSLLVLWRAFPERFQPSRKGREAPAARRRVLRSRVVEGRAQAGGVGGGGGTGSSAATALAARVVGLEEEGIFRRIVMFL